MKNSKNKSFTKYRNLVEEIEQHTDILETMHSKFMKCKNGCDLCCIDFSIFPIEYHFILNEIEKTDTKLESEGKSKGNVCSFLKNHSCTIYKHRPIMCRTHGLPLIYANDEGEFELSACELNFTKFDFNDFTMENTLPQDKYNSKLFLLNREFIATFKEKNYNETDLIPLKELAKHFEK
jgi:Fe-S-cluster containining protein